VGWSTALRGEVINESLGQLPKELAAGSRVLARTESSRTQLRARAALTTFKTLKTDRGTGFVTGSLIGPLAGWGRVGLL
jgi:hypothetical protein